MAHATINDIRIYYELNGPEDAPVLVLSNGILMSAGSWAMQVPVLSKFFRVLTYDCRGMWQSDHPPGPYSMAQHADDLAALLDALAIPAAHIGGISYGGEISLVFARKYPQKTCSLIVSSAVSHVDAPLRAVVEPWFEAARRKNPELLFDVTAPLNFSPSWSAANRPVLEAARQRYTHLDLDAFLWLMESFAELNVTPELPEIKAPALVMVGELDTLKSRCYAEIIAKGLSGAEFAVLPGAGHAACWEKPELWNTLVLGFVSKHSRDN